MDAFAPFRAMGRRDRKAHAAVGCVAAFALLLCGHAHADSPLTSTDLSTAYLDVPEVAHATKIGQLDARLETYLLDPRTPPDRAVAVINALGPDITDANSNHLVLLRRLEREDPHRFREFRLGRGDGNLLLVIGYSWAMTDYHDSAKAQALLRVAARRLPDSFAAAFAHALARAQGDTHRDGHAAWCRIYTGPRALIDGWGGRRIDLRTDAIDTAMEYLVLYKDDCR
jgi:hypothetical protein